MKRDLPRNLLKEFQEELNEFVKGFADCSICGVCCIEENLTLYNPDINLLSKKLDIDKKSFLEKYTHYNNKTKETLMNMPCPFFKNGKCSMYSIRPKNCRNYPIFILKDGLVRIVEIEGCAISTHFNELFLDFCEKNYPDFYKQVMSQDKDFENKDSIKNAIYSINIVALFIESINR